MHFRVISNKTLFLGVHGAANKIKLEKCAMNQFCLRDFKGNLLESPVVCLEKSGKCQSLATKLNVDKITKTLNEQHANEMFESVSFNL